jgi:hypothetical protein
MPMFNEHLMLPLIVLGMIKLKTWMLIWNHGSMLPLIVPESHQVKDMDAYLEPWIEEILLLWNGIQMYDIS